MAITALEQEPCDDCISREATVKMLCKIAKIVNKERDGLGSPYAMAALFIQDNKDEFPPVTPQPKMGRWINKARGSLIDRYVCSACDKEPCQKKYRNTWGWDFTRYCPNCGAKMQEVKE